MTLMEDFLFLTLLILPLLNADYNLTTRESTHQPSLPQDDAPDPVSMTPPLPQSGGAPQAAPLKLGMLHMRWRRESPCEGEMVMLLAFGSFKYICFNAQVVLPRREVCEQTKCGDFLEQKASTKKYPGYTIHMNHTVTNSTGCNALVIRCKDKHSRELLGYRCVVALLSVLFLAVVLLRFAPPTYAALCKRLSQKRQNRWIGPTQSQSVCYHRNQGGLNPNNNTMKRQSYPGLEMLTVNQSREPSSNRNSDCSYN